jgi:hypothetical protein
MLSSEGRAWWLLSRIAAVRSGEEGAAARRDQSKRAGSIFGAMLASNALDLPGELYLKIINSNFITMCSKLLYVGA